MNYTGSFYASKMTHLILYQVTVWSASMPLIRRSEFKSNQIKYGKQKSDLKETGVDS